MPDTREVWKCCSINLSQQQKSMRLNLTWAARQISEFWRKTKSPCRLARRRIWGFHFSLNSDVLEKIYIFGNNNVPSNEESDPEILKHAFVTQKMMKKTFFQKNNLPGRHVVFLEITKKKLCLFLACVFKKTKKHVFLITRVHKKTSFSMLNSLDEKKIHFPNLNVPSVFFWKFSVFAVYWR